MTHYMTVVTSAVGARDNLADYYTTRLTERRLHAEKIVDLVGKMAYIGQRHPEQSCSTLLKIIGQLLRQHRLRSLHEVLHGVLAATV
ncbi:hypothetical protein [Streptomyces sp. NPDC057686]|uniref:hypothetical protein n=1 Tax=Streptomyces TaxID=1883 RepID=UPI0036BB2B8D